MQRLLAMLLMIGVVLVGAIGAEEPATVATSQPGQGRRGAPTTKKSDEPVITRHQVTLDGQPLEYTATTGFIPLKDSTGKLRARVFFMAYDRTLGDEAQRKDRPLTFVFNGGPGAASVWLHLGTAGPWVVAMPDNGLQPAPPYRLRENQSTWLDFTDLVFIDPVGTGFSRAEPDKAKEFYSVSGDVSSVAEVIRLYMTKYERWSSPLFVAGESYGTTRAAGLSEYLHDRYGIDLNGIALISTVLNFQTLQFNPGNDTPYPLWLPSYTAIAWYHKKLDEELQKDLEKTIAEAQNWAMDEYLPALLKGSSLTDPQRSEIEQKLSRYTGLPLDYVRKSKLKITPWRFEKQLLSAEGKILGRMDGRLSAHDSDPLGDSPEFDPSLTGYVGIFSSCFNDYVRRQLDFESELSYEFLSPDVRPWDWGEERGYLNVADRLSSAMAKVPSMKVIVCSGYYDLATPFGAADYTLNQMPLGDLRKNITHQYYEGGHMMYLNVPSLAKLKRDLKEFYESALTRE